MSKHLTPLMLQGCTSDAGKSYLAAGFCRLYANRGIRVAPFKAQNMSNNAGVTTDGGEIGRAQLLQAQACRLDSSVHMNPILLKPEADSRSQVIVHGKARPDLSALPWHDRKAHLWQYVEESLAHMQANCDLLIIEGAGSPAEINLRSGDIVNMRVAHAADAKVLLASDIDRGGSFAHLLGTWHCLDDSDKSRLAGFLLNKFRGDPSLLGDATGWLQAQCGVPTLGTIPMLPLPLPVEDAYSHSAEAVSADCTSGTSGTSGIIEAQATIESADSSSEQAHHCVNSASKGAMNRPDKKPVVAVIMTPYISNFDEFDALLNEPGIEFRFVRELSGLSGDIAAVILPGSKHVSYDLNFLKQQGFAARIHQLASQGCQIIGQCGGLQMLGKALLDPHQLENGLNNDGLNLLDISTTLEPEKTTLQTNASLNNGAQVTGYEIHHGVTECYSGTQPHLHNQAGEVIGYQRGNVCGSYLHGIFDNAVYRQEFLSKLGVSATLGDWEKTVDAALDTLAEHLNRHCDIAAIDRLIGL